MDVHDKRDGEDLYRVLTEELIPLFTSAIRTACRAAGSAA